VATWSFIEYLDNSGYTPWTHSSWSQYSVVLKQGDTLNVNTIYNGTNTSAYEAQYVYAPSGSTTVNDPDPTATTNNNDLLDKTWSTSSFSNTNHHSRWFFFTATSAGPGIANGYAGIRILTIPSTFGWGGVESSIEQNSAGNAQLTIPSSFESYIQGTAAETADSLSTNGSYDERFHWRITNSASSHTAVSSGFAASSGDFVGPSSGDFISIQPNTSAVAQVYYIKLYHYDYNGNTGTANTLIDVGSFSVTALAPLDTTITLDDTSIGIAGNATSYQLQMSGGGSNTLYYILNTNQSYASTFVLDTLRTNNDSRYIGRTFVQNDANGKRPFETDSTSSNIIDHDLPALNTVKTNYIYATDGLSKQATLLTNTYAVARADTDITLPSSQTIGTNVTSFTASFTGDSVGTQYRLIAYIGGIFTWVSTANYGDDFTIASGNLPANGGDSITYVGQARPVISGTAYGDWMNLTGTTTQFVLTRATPTYSVAGPTGGTVNEGQNLTFDITTSNVVNGTTVGWTLSGLQSGDYTTSASSPATIQNNAASVTFAIVNDNVTDGNKTATLTLASTDSTGASTGSPAPSASVTVVDTSNPGGGGGTGGGTGGGGAGTYGLLIRNSGDTQTIIDGSSRITNFLASDSIDTNSQSSKTMFTNFDCSEKTVTGFIVTWDGALYSTPTITRRSSSLGGITVTKASNDTGSATAGVATVELVRY